MEYRIVTRDEYDHLVNVSTFNHMYEMFGERTSHMRRDNYENRQ